MAPGRMPHTPAIYLRWLSAPSALKEQATARLLLRAIPRASPVAHFRCPACYPRHLQLMSGATGNLLRIAWLQGQGQVDQLWTFL